jgi:C4-dicarboxylate transporter, DctM subunit
LSTELIALLGIGILVLVMLIGIPVAYAMAIVGLIGISLLNSLGAGLSLLSTDFWQTFYSYDLTVIPMFVLMGALAFNCGISKKLYNTANAFVGHFPGGIALATMVGSAFFAAICGSTSASAAAMGRVAMPEMKAYKYSPSLSSASVAAGGTLGILIPPSTAFIIYGILTGESIGKLFIAGIIPGILLTILYMAVIYFQCRISPLLGPAGQRTNWKGRLAALPGSIDMLIIFLLVMGGLFTGIFTATEAGAIGAGGTLVLSLIRRQLTWSGFLNSLLDTTLISGMVFVILGGALVFGRFIAYTQITTSLTNWLSSSSLPVFVVIWLIVIFYFLAGCFLDMLALVTLTVPIFFPIITSLGLDPIWFGVLLVLCGDMGIITPPVGLNIYIIHAIAPDIPLGTMFKGVWGFVGSIVVAIIIVVYFPQIATFLPNLMMK